MRAVLGLVVTLAACRGGGPRGGPGATLDAYLSAVQTHRLDQAYALLSSDYRRTHDRAAFERALAGWDPRSAARLKSGRVTLRARVDLPDGGELPLVWEDGAWRMAGDPLDFYPQATPEEALRSFVRAVENRRYDVVLKFVPARYRATVTVEKLRERWEGERRGSLLDDLALARAHLGEPFAWAPSGDEATLSLGASKKQVRLAREDGAWKVEAVE